MNIKEPNTQTDGELVSRALHNKQEFAEIVNRYQEPLRRYLFRLGCKDSNDVEDMLQNVFIKIYINLNDYDSSLKFSSWLYRITHNEAIDLFRKNKVQPVFLHHEDIQQIFENIADDIDITESIHRKQNQEMISKSLLKLDNPYRDVLVLRFLEEKSYDEISDILKIPSGTVATVINRGKKLLKKMLGSKL